MTTSRISHGVVKTPLSDGKVYQSDSVRVAVRVRPLSNKETLDGSKSCVDVVDDCILLADKQFDFDAAFDATTPQDKLFETIVQPLVDEFLNGYNVTVFAYGQTGSGKTYTMGNELTSTLAPTDPGIISHVIEHLFNYVNGAAQTQQIVLKLSYLEVLNEEISDLLASSSSIDTSSVGLAIRGDGDRGISISGLSEHVVTSAAQAQALLRSGTQLRATASTNMNAQSSRSHAICTLVMEHEPANGGQVHASKLHLVDLAGSERVRCTNSEGARFKEGVNINRGLFALGNVINALSKRRRTPLGTSIHVPYRDSKLTRLLQDSLGGNSKTLIIACLSPAEVNQEETLNTLRYAYRARKIENRVRKHKDKGVENDVTRLKEEVAGLKRQLEEQTQGKEFTPHACLDGNDLVEENQRLKQELVVVKQSEAKWRKIARALQCKLKEGSNEGLKTTKKKRKVRESYETLPSSSEEDEEEDDDESDYVDEEVERCRSKRTTSGKKKKKTQSSNVLNEIDEMLATSAASCCKCRGKCATKACVCKSRSQTCSAECSCNSTHCRNQPRASTSDHQVPVA